MKTALLQKCILNHRESVKLEGNGNEEIWVVDVAAILHFDSVPSLLYLVWDERKINIKQGANFVREKLKLGYYRN